VADAAIAMMEGKRATAFLDLLGARLAFERAGTRLYEALLVKLAAADPRPEGPTREDLERLRDDEARHFVLLKRAIEELGGDPTVMTPGADVVGVSGAGWVQVLADPRTTLTEGLKTILQAELVDGEQWLMLADIALRLGHLEMAEHFRAALAEEEEHLDLVRGWVVSSVESQIGLEADTRDESPQVPAP
jgi:rubrerythrin